MNEAKITSITESSASENGAIIPVILVTFTVGKFGPFIERIPKAQFSQAEMTARLQAFASKLPMQS